MDDWLRDKKRCSVDMVGYVVSSTGTESTLYTPYYQNKCIFNIVTNTRYISLEVWLSRDYVKVCNGTSGEDWESVIYLEGLPEGFPVYKEHGNTTSFGKKLHWTNHKTSVVMFYGQMRSKWSCLDRTMFGSSRNSRNISYTVWSIWDFLWDVFLPSKSK